MEMLWVLGINLLHMPGHQRTSKVPLIGGQQKAEE